MQDVEQWLAQRQQQGLYRQEVVTAPRPQAHIAVWQGQSELHCINFASNDYLGLGEDLSLRQIFAEAALTYGAAATGSPLLTGFHPVHRQLTEQLATWLGFDDVLLFSSGFAANQAMLSSLVGEDEWLVMDKLCHASMQDVASQRPRFSRFLHNDYAQLAARLAKLSSPALIATEGVFSMDGDSPDLPALLHVAGANPVVVDDAHGLGVQGHAGAGTLSAQQIAPSQVRCYMANFGKALACQGGFLAGDRQTIDFIRQQSRHYIYSTAMSPAIAALLSATVTVVQTQQWRRDKLAENIGLFREGALRYGIALHDSSTAIQPIELPSSLQVLSVRDQLALQGIWLSAVRPPTVQKPRFRVTLSTLHSTQQITQLLHALAKVFE